MTTKPRLIAVSGPAAGTAFSLSAGEVSIGRGASNEICVNDHSISRQHCLVKQENESFKVIDLESYNGTFVNGLPVLEQYLTHGDQIAVGSVLFLFLTEEETAETSPQPSVELANVELANPSTIRLARSDAVYLKEAAAVTTLPAEARVARDLDALLEISMSLSTMRDLASLQRTLLETVLQTIPADRGALLLVNGNAEETSYGIDKRSQSEQTIQISRAVAEKVLREGVAILSVDTSQDEGLRDAESLLVNRVCSLLCVPLVLRERTFGLVYLDTSNPAIVLDEGHLQLLTAAGAIAAVAIENVQHLEWLQGENQRLHEEIDLEHNMIGESARMRDVFRFIKKIAPADATVLIRGESGTGKELVAHAIHDNSERAAKQFLAINCAVLSEALLESELFGYEKGAFTSAVAQKRGRLELADGGSLFLDEVGELTPGTQAKLLRVLQERQFERLGGTRTINVDVRIIAATNRDLEEAIKAGTFRQDLYYRLNVISLTLPPLRERREDIPLLAYHFVAKYSKKCKRPVSGISPETRHCLLAYDWPGNVREMENAIERAVVLGNTEVIVPDDLPESLIATSPPEQKLASYHEAVNEMKKQFILRAIEQASGNYTEAAKLLGIHPANLHRLIRTLGLRASIGRDG
ncbi:MAG TPA: sigma 54-interacting transcriptional regulator [Pyrinomonadaceae bacterium]|nr:sigma 54-interacting transcriptional regulator [Pyrinomonadaceae bacterium]